MLTPAQKVTLAAALRASVVPAVVAALAARDDNALAAWLNTATATMAWKHDVSKRDHFEATDVAKFDNITAGKRDAWRMMQDNTPLDMGRQKNRKAVLDAWGAADATPVLTDFTRAATNGELIFGNTDATTNAVTAKKLDVPGTISQLEVSEALNQPVA